MSHFGSLITAMITPFTEDNGDGYPAVDYEALDKLVTHLLNTSSDAIIVSGTTGESPTLTHDEEEEVFRFVKSKVSELNPNVKVLFGTGSNCTQTVMKSNRKAEEYGADGVLIVTPYYNKPNQKGLKAHFNRIAKATSLPIILYNIPGRSVINLEAETIIDLVNDNPNILALKEATTNLDQISALRQVFDKNRFQIYSGDDSLTLPMMAVGADGVISVASHLVGKEMKDMIESFNDSDTAKAEFIHNRLFPLFGALFWEPNPTCVKAALSMLGICSPALREPLVELEPEQFAKLKGVIDSIVLAPAS